MIHAPYRMQVGLSTGSSMGFLLRPFDPQATYGVSLALDSWRHEGFLTFFRYFSGLQHGNWS
jgi:hypothetical protein